MGAPGGAQLRVFALLYAAYAVCYVCKRLNYGTLVEHGVVAASDVGSFGSAFEVAGGAVKVVAGVVVDLFSPTAVLLASLAVASASNLLFFSAPSLGGKVGLWALNGGAQALAWPAIARIFMAWFPQPVSRGTWYSALSTSQNFGAAAAPHLLAPITAAAGWRAGVTAPGVLGAGTAVVLAGLLADAPPPPSGAAGQPAAAAAKSPPAPPPPPSLAVAARSVLCSPRLWALGASYFCCSVVRSGLADWAPVFLADVGRGRVPPATARACVSALELGGAAGGLFAGWASDALAGGRRAPVMILASLATAPLLLAAVALAGAAAAEEGGGGSDGGAMASPWGLWFPASLPSSSSWLAPPAALALLPLCYAALGFAVYAPHVLNGLASAEAVPPAVSSSGAALSKTLGQLGGAVGGLPLGRLALARGWGAAMMGLAGCALVGAAATAPLWGARPWAAPAAQEPPAAAAAAELAPKARHDEGVADAGGGPALQLQQDASEQQRPLRRRRRT